MRVVDYQKMLVLCAPMLPGCTIKGYTGATLPDAQVATVTLKAPVISLIPLFWVFPLNMLTWFDGDWYETSWRGVGNDEWYETSWTDGSIKINQVELNRFTSVAVLPGQNLAVARKPYIIQNKIIDGPNCTYSPCTCTEKGKNKEKVCEKTISCTSTYRVTARDRTCRIDFNAETTQKYEVYIRNSNLILSNVGDHRCEEGNCSWSSEYTYETKDDGHSTSRCAN